MNLAWMYLLIGALAEVVYGVGLYHSKGFTLPGPSVLSLFGGIMTTVFLGLAMKQLPIGISFVVWSGLAAVGTAGYGILYLGEARDLMRLALMAMIVFGIAGLKMTSSC